MSQRVASLQEQHAPDSICFGCGPANAEGLHINSYPKGDEVIAEWNPEPKYEAFPGCLYGGLIASLLDCHCNWTAAYHLMQKNGMDKVPCTVTAELNVKFARPTPSDRPVKLVARVVESKERLATVEGELYSGDDLCASSRAVFVAVKPGHPAYHRW